MATVPMGQYTIIFPIAFSKVFSAVCSSKDVGGVWSNINISGTSVKISSRGTDGYGATTMWYCALGQ